MRTRTSWLAGLLLVLLCTPSMARAQGPHYGPPQFEVPLPLMWGQRDTGPYAAAEAMFMRVNVPLRHQIIAVRGLWDEAGSLDGSTNPNNFLVNVVDPAGNFLNQAFAFQGNPGQFLGTKNVALTARQDVDDRWEAGCRLTIGWRLQDGIAFEGVYWKLADFRHTSGASLMPPTAVGFGAGGVRNDFADSFLSSPFFNFSPFFGGPDRDVISNIIPSPIDPATGTSTADAAETADFLFYGGLPLPAFGITNAYEDITLQFDQSIWNAELNIRLPICETDCTRTTALAGFRYFHLFEHFGLRISDADVDGFIAPENVVEYKNQWKNQMYGVQAGMMNEAYLGNGFALSVEGRLAMFANYRKTEVTFTRGDDNAVGLKRNSNDFSATPMFQLGAHIWWYPIEGVQLRAGYEFIGMANVLRCGNPVSFNLGNIAPVYEEMYFQTDGFNMGVALIF